MNFYEIFGSERPWEKETPFTSLRGSCLGILFMALLHVFTLLDNSFAEVYVLSIAHCFVCPFCVSVLSDNVKQAV